MGEDCVTIFVDCEEEVALGVEGESCDVPSVCERECV